jgi:pSer/pThr/pTyr-binding forkhead associated (FHA) protein
MQQPQGGFGAPPYAPAAKDPSVLPPPAVSPNEPILRGFLVSYHANKRGEFWPLAGGKTVLGRAGAGEAVNIAIADPTVSSRHASFQVDAAAGTITLEDEGSTNGTYVNEEHVGFNGKRELRDGDRVRCGAFLLVVKIVGRI